MKQYVTIDKRSKKAQKEYYSKQRGTWGELNPVTRSVPSGKTYNRNKEKQKNRKKDKKWEVGTDLLKNGKFWRIVYKKRFEGRWFHGIYYFYAGS